MAELKQQYEEKLSQKEELRKKAEHTEMMLDRASKLVSGLSGERDRWEETVKVLISIYCRLGGPPGITFVHYHYIRRLCLG